MVTSSKTQPSKILKSFQERIKSAHKVVHVMPRGNAWIVRRGRAGRAYRTGLPYEQAVIIAKNFKTADELVIHHKNGNHERIALVQ